MWREKVKKTENSIIQSNFSLFFMLCFLPSKLRVVIVGNNSPSNSPRLVTFLGRTGYSCKWFPIYQDTKCWMYQTSGLVNFFNSISENGVVSIKVIFYTFSKSVKKSKVVQCQCVFFPSNLDYMENYLNELRKKNLNDHNSSL